MIYDPFDEKFAFPGYLRAASLVAANPSFGEKEQSQGTLEVRSPLQLGCESGCTFAGEFARQLQVAHPTSQWKFMTPGIDPWQLLDTTAVNNSNEILDQLFTTYTPVYNDQGPGLDLDCIDYQDPYDYDTSVTIPTYNTCQAFGFIYASGLLSATRLSRSAR